jgi:hypothetical protein
MRDKLIGWRAVYPTSVWRCSPPGFTIIREVHNRGQNVCAILTTPCSQSYLHRLVSSLRRTFSRRRPLGLAELLNAPTVGDARTSKVVCSSGAAVASSHVKANYGKSAARGMWNSGHRALGVV